MIPTVGKVDVELATTCEAQSLGISDLIVAELEIKLEDSMQIASD